MSKVMTQSLRERAYAALESAVAERTARQDEAAREDREQAITALRVALVNARDWLGSVPEPSGPTLEVDGVAFRGVRLHARDRGPFGLVAVGACPNCGAETTCEPLNSLADLGMTLADVHPNIGHRCGREAPPATAAPTLAEELEGVIRRIVREEIGRGHGDE